MTIAAVPEAWLRGSHKADHAEARKQLAKVTIAKRASRRRAQFTHEAVRPEFGAVSHTVRQLAALRQSDDYARLNSETERKTIQFVQAVSRGSQVPPTVLPDEDGLAVLHWVSGGHSFVVEIGEAGPISLWSKRDGEPAETVADPWRILNIARQLVTRYTRAADAVNPFWRGLFVH